MEQLIITQLIESGGYLRYFATLPLFFIGILVSTMLTPIIGQAANALGVVNETKKTHRNSLNKFENINRRINPNTVPLLGGLATMIPLIAAIPIFFGFTDVTTPIFIALSILVIGGIFDDIFNLPAVTQFGIQIFAASIIAASVINIDSINLPFLRELDMQQLSYAGEFMNIAYDINLPGDLILITWLLVLTNAIKWVGGVDALLESTTLISVVAILVLGFRVESMIVIVLASLFAGNLSGFLFFNFPPAKIFTASSGKSAFGFVLGILAILADAKVTSTLAILLVPLVDFTVVILKRAFNSSPQNFRDFISIPVKVMRGADTNHLHHKLLQNGFSQRDVLRIEVVISLLAATLGLAIAGAYRTGIVMSAIAIAISVIIWLHLRADIYQFRKSQQSESTPEQKYSY